MGPGELEELRRQIDEMIDKGWIKPSESEFGAPVLFVPKKGGKLRMCIDYRSLNRITRKNAYPLPRIDDLLDVAGGCKVFSKIDLKSGYHQIEVDLEDQHRTAFKTHDGLLTNAPTTFQSLMDKVLREQIGRFVVVYLDDILIFSKSMEEHLKHLEEVLAILKKTQLHLNLEKSEFGRDSVIYLGHRLSAAGLEPEATKIEVIRDWPQPVNIRELRSFLGLASYYRKFVPRFSIIAHPLSRLTSKNVSYSWDAACTEAFRTLKEALVSYPVLRIADPKLTFVVTTDASQYGIGAVLQQDDGDGLRPLEYYNKRMPSVKVATSTYMRELYASRMALDHWKHYLLGCHFKVFSDHETLKWIKMQTTLSPTLLRWFHEIDIFDFELRHKKGCYNRVADALSRYPEYMTCLVKSYDLRKKLKEDLGAFTVGGCYVSPVPRTAKTKVVFCYPATSTDLFVQIISHQDGKAAGCSGKSQSASGFPPSTLESPVISGLELRGEEHPGTPSSDLGEQERAPESMVIDRCRERRDRTAEMKADADRQQRDVRIDLTDDRLTDKDVQQPNHNHLRNRPTQELKGGGHESMAEGTAMVGSVVPENEDHQTETAVSDMAAREPLIMESGGATGGTSRARRVRLPFNTVCLVERRFQVLCTRRNGIQKDSPHREEPGTPAASEHFSQAEVIGRAASSGFSEVPLQPSPVDDTTSLAKGPSFGVCVDAQQHPGSTVAATVIGSCSDLQVLEMTRAFTEQQQVSDTNNEWSPCSPQGCPFAQTTPPPVFLRHMGDSDWVLIRQLADGGRVNCNSSLPVGPPDRHGKQAWLSSCACGRRSCPPTIGDVRRRKVGVHYAPDMMQRVTDAWAHMKLLPAPVRRSLHVAEDADGHILGIPVMGLSLCANISFEAKFRPEVPLISACKAIWAV
ncbi:hypothetical protein CBR_g23431 [Chara braunii]|uniref:Reverse transcriptase domain-containing protein n=1 Tax=Chara braunii TaxID=69332 RepID=A0A388L474_CHABU|nr:hypothetical protein CBR_g23431 [Chara braunii]|eukprot:GBG77106.1 hypothetical protein CBR_g23431 [Chara braunii]